MKASFSISLLSPSSSPFAYLNESPITSTPTALKHGDEIIFHRPPTLPDPLSFTFVTSNSPFELSSGKMGTRSGEESVGIREE